MSFIFMGLFGLVIYAGKTKPNPSWLKALGFSTTSGVLGVIFAIAGKTYIFFAAAITGNLGLAGVIFMIGYLAMMGVMIWNVLWCWSKRKPFTLVR